MLLKIESTNDVIKRYYYYYYYYYYCSHEAERLEQKAKGALERQKITDEAEAEKSRKDLLELQANR